MPQQDKVPAIYNSALAPGEGARLDLPKKQLQVKGLSLLHSRDFFLTRKHSDTKIFLFCFVNQKDEKSPKMHLFLHF